MKKSDLATYFHPDNWDANYGYFKQTGWDLLKRIDSSSTVLDVGCGYNLFKQSLGEMLYGIDPYNHHADEVVSIEDFEPYEFDVVLCLGSINFGDEATILNQINKVVGCTKHGGTIYWRQNPGQRDRKFKGIENIDFFPWSFEKNLEFAKYFDCKVKTLDWDGDRIFAVWERNYVDVICSGS